MGDRFKTLKDFETTVDCQLDGDSISGIHDVALIDDLRQEAIKWAKATIIERDKYGSPGVNTTAWCGKNSMKTQLHFIKQFFNITEEDLQ